MKIAGKKIGLSTQVFSAMILGAVLGLLFGDVMVKLEFIDVYKRQYADARLEMSIL